VETFLEKGGETRENGPKIQWFRHIKCVLCMFKWHLILDSSGASVIASMIELN
jgi:hypothetical protein